MPGTRPSGSLIDFAAKRSEKPLSAPPLAAPILTVASPISTGPISVETLSLPSRIDSSTVKLSASAAVTTPFSASKSRA